VLEGHGADGRDYYETDEQLAATWLSGGPTSRRQELPRKGASSTRTPALATVCGWMRRQGRWQHVNDAVIIRDGVLVGARARCFPPGTVV